jgi:eukaryotic-like serine/threonine-protein kinase
MSELPPCSAVDVVEQPLDPTLGRTIAGKYAIQQRLGAGAMGVVYLARQVALEKAVAIKVLHRELSVDESFTERFRREAWAASRLDHPNSIRVFDFGQEPDGLLYLAMEYVEGRDLFAFLKDHAPLPRESIVDLLSQVLAALAVAHELGVLHRDLKPENIMIVRGKGDDGQPLDVVKVCDFGIAKIVETSLPRAGEDARRHTTKGLVVGTPEYMSPEQARGEALDGRSDLYSVGVILYELLTGRIPFEGDSPLNIVLKHVGELPAPPSSLAPNVDRQLEAVCMRVLEKQPSDRFSSAREMRLALRSALGASPAPPAPVALSLRAFGDTVAESPLHDRNKPTLEGLTPLQTMEPAKRSRPWLATSLLILAAGAVLLVISRGAARAPPSVNVPTASQAAIAPVARVNPEPRAEDVSSPPTPPPGLPAPSRSADAVRVSDHGGRPHHAKGDAPTPPPAPPESAPIPLPQVAANDMAMPAIEAPEHVAPPPPPTATPSPVPAPPSEPPPPAYDLASARVEVGQAVATIGATSSSVTRAVSEASAQLTACYKSALPRLTGATEGRGRLHVETDGAGVITDARLTAPMDASVARCVVQAIQGRRVANVDTGSASADVPLVFRAH